MKEMNVFKAGCYQNFFNAPIKNYQLVANWTSLDHDLVKYKRVFRHGGRCQNSTVMAELQNDNLVSKPTRHCIVLDIEGTTTPISFVTDVLFPYARDNVQKHLMLTYGSQETKDDINLLRAQVLDDLEKGIRGSVPIPPDDAGKEAVIESLVTNVRAMIAADRKITALKQLQGHIWRTGFQSNELQGVVYEDVPEALKKWHADGIKVYIYSSGSRESQRLIFGNTTYGDLRKYLNKKEPHSYFEISQSVGVDEPSQVLFLTDVYQEAVAAKAAGLEVIISVRPGNAALPENHGFRTVTSFAEV
ncbi:Enolase-phosphatase E1 protein [Dioscorea alata]|uniref:Enolase-phosphatase E1 protein n=1 Tax=Dioscorea alata TaxID=55571 RepID=A0ACB7V9K7_DIOAL|nr:Enolase-phosphatase E1 protein [Dioscorea alata]